jgi:hypothetical protein
MRRLRRLLPSGLLPSAPGFHRVSPSRLHGRGLRALTAGGDSHPASETYYVPGSKGSTGGDFHRYLGSLPAPGSRPLPVGGAGLVQAIAWCRLPASSRTIPPSGGPCPHPRAVPVSGPLPATPWAAWLSHARILSRAWTTERTAPPPPERSRPRWTCRKLPAKLSEARVGESPGQSPILQEASHVEALDHDRAVGLDQLRVTWWRSASRRMAPVVNRQDSAPPPFRFRLGNPIRGPERRPCLASCQFLSARASPSRNTFDNDASFHRHCAAAPESASAQNPSVRRSRA